MKRGNYAAQDPRDDPPRKARPASRLLHASFRAVPRAQRGLCRARPGDRAGLRPARRSDLPGRAARRRVLPLRPDDRGAPRAERPRRPDVVLRDERGLRPRARAARRRGRTGERSDALGAGKRYRQDGLLRAGRRRLRSPRPGRRRGGDALRHRGRPGRVRCQRPRRAVGGADRDVASAAHHRHRVREPGGPRRRGRAEGRRRQRRRELERRRSALPRRLRLEQAALQRREQHHQLLRNHVERQVLLDAGDRGDQRVRHGRQHQPARQGGRRRDPRDAQARPRQLGISRIPERRGQGPARRVRRRAQRSLPVHRLRDLRYEPQRRARTDRGGAAVHRGGLRSLRGRRHTVNLGLPMGAVQHGQRQLRTRRNRQPRNGQQNRGQRLHLHRGNPYERHDPRPAHAHEHRRARTGTLSGTARPVRHQLHGKRPRSDRRSIPLVGLRRERTQLDGRRIMGQIHHR